MMRPFLAALILAPVAALNAEEEPPFRTAVTVEKGVYKKGWERDFFRELFPAEERGETPDALGEAPDEEGRRSVVRQPSRRRVPLSIGRNDAERPRMVEVPDAGTISEKEKETGEASVPTPAEHRPSPSSRPEKELFSDMPQEHGPPAENATRRPAVDAKKKQKERSRELENRRKKGNFRDPKITY